jgi:hypothetical protein
VAYDVLTWLKATQRACERINAAGGGQAAAALAFPRVHCRWGGLLLGGSWLVCSSRPAAGRLLAGASAAC